VKLTTDIKLHPTKEQADALKETLRLANAAANEVSRLAWEAKTFGQFKLHKLAYTAIREQFGLSAQVAVRVIAKVADAYKLDRRRQRTAGVRVITVDPRNTSRQCAQCGHIAKGNRKSQAKFQCQQCGHTRNADTNAAAEHSEPGGSQSAKRGRQRTASRLALAGGS
jgi:predicted transposase